MGNLITKKGKKKESTAPVLNVKEAIVKILSAEYHGIGDVITKNDGSTFTVQRPHIAAELELIDGGRFKKGDVGTRWYEKFYYPETEEGSGEYENRPGTKIGALSEARYGEGFWESDQVLKAEDLPDFVFLCTLEPKTEFGGTKVTGTHIVHNSIEAMPAEDAELSDEEESQMHASLGESKAS
jgi:hypothetical protein